MKKDELKGICPYAVCVLAVFLISLLVSACGKRTNGTPGNGDGQSVAGVQAAPSLQTEGATVYHREEPFAVTGMQPFHQARDLFFKGERLYVQGYQDLGEGEGITYVESVRLDENGEAAGDIRLVSFTPEEENTSYHSFTADREGNLYALKYAVREGVTNPTGERDYLTTIVKVKDDGTPVWEKEIPQGNNPEEVFNIYEIYLADGTGIVAQTTQGIFLYDKETGEEVRKLMDDDDWYTPLMARDGALFLASSDALLEIDVQKGGVKREITLDTYYWDVCAGMTHDFYLTDYHGIYTMNAEDERPKPLVNCMTSDITATIDRIVPLADGSVLALLSEDRYYESATFAASVASGAESRISRLVADPSFNEGKTLLTMGVTWVGTDIRNAIVSFNRTNPDYRIEVIDYTLMSDDGFDDPNERLKAALIAGNVPDLVMLERTDDLSIYYEKGIFEALDPYLEADTELDLSAFFPNVLDAMRYKGSLYCLSGSFSVMSVLAKSSVAETAEAWTFADMEALAARYNLPSSQLFGEGGETRYGMLTTLLMTDKDLVDDETGTCHFDTETFARMLAFCKELPEPNDIVKHDSTMDWRKGQALLLSTGIYGASDFHYLICGLFDAPVTALGFPSADGKGRTLVQAFDCVGMSALSAHKDGCYAFLKTIFSDTYQQGVQYDFPLSIAETTRRIKAQEEVPGERIGYMQMGEKTEVRDFTAEDTQMLLNLIMSAEGMVHTDNTLIAIVHEEAAAYFAEEKTAEEVAQIIQRRASVYLQERH